MARTPDSARLAQLKKEADELARKIKELEAKEKEQARKDLARRIHLTGTIILDYVEKNPEDPFTLNLMKILDKMAKPADRQVLGLPEKA